MQRVELEGFTLAEYLAWSAHAGGVVELVDVDGCIVLLLRPNKHGEFVMDARLRLCVWLLTTLCFTNADLL